MVGKASIKRESKQVHYETSKYGHLLIYLGFDSFENPGQGGNQKFVNGPLKIISSNSCTNCRNKSSNAFSWCFQGLWLAQTFGNIIAKNKNSENDLILSKKRVIYWR